MGIPESPDDLKKELDELKKELKALKEKKDESK
jgi:ribosomal protein L29